MNNKPVLTTESEELFWATEDFIKERLSEMVPVRLHAVGNSLPQLGDNPGCHIFDIEKMITELLEDE